MGAPGGARFRSGAGVHAPAAVRRGLEALLRRRAPVPARSRHQPAPQDRAGPQRSATHHHRTGCGLSLHSDAVTPKKIRYVEWALWLGILVLSTVIMRGARPDIEQAHAAFVYILIVLGATAGGERWLGTFGPIIGFLAIT